MQNTSVFLSNISTMECPTTLATTTATPALSPTTSPTSSSQATTAQSTSAASSNTSEDEIRRHFQRLTEPMERMVQTFLAGGGVSQVQNSDLPASLHGNPVPIPMFTFNIIVQPREVTVWETNQVNCERAEVDRAEMMAVNSICNFNYAAPQVSDNDDNDDSTRTDDNNKNHEITKMEVTESGKLTLLLVGRTGNGKSSTGNSILGRKPFTPRGSTTAITDEILKQTADIDGQEITVVDGPGIGDASFDNYNDIKATLTQVGKALDLCPNGFSALLIVLKYGIRFTKQEKDAITMIKSIFGPDVVRKYGVIVMSHGDSFELAAESEEMSFEDWCKEQTGDVKALFTECDYRCVLFNNRTKDLEQLKAQLDSLMSKVTCICSQVENYTPEHYKEAEGERTKMLVKSKLLQIEKETDEVFNEIRDRLDRGNYTKNESLEMLNACSAKISKLKSDLQNDDKNTGCTKELQKKVELLETTVQLKLKRIQAQTSEHAEAGKNQNGGSSVMSYLTGMVSRGRATIPSLSGARDKIVQIPAYARFTLGDVTETPPDDFFI